MRLQIKFLYFNLQQCKKRGEQWAQIPQMITVEIYAVCVMLFLGPFHYPGVTLIPAWISNYIHYTVWDRITYLFRLSLGMEK